MLIIPVLLLLWQFGVISIAQHRAISHILNELSKKLLKSAEKHDEQKFKNSLFYLPRADESWSGRRRWFVPEKG